MRHIINFSGGLCSFWTAHRVVQKYGAADVTLLFADTLIEHPDLYRFNEQASAILGVPITVVSKGMTPWQLFKKQGLIGNNRFPICSVMLKREPLDKWISENCTPGDSVRYVGFDWTEEHRLTNIRKELPEWTIEAPMCESPLWSKCRMQEEAIKIGLEIPRLYTQGFPHNNCGGRCVRAGISHWVHLYHVDRPAFDEWADDEKATNLDFETRGITALSILRDRRGGTTKNLWLKDLAAEIDAGIRHDKEDWGGCGCGGAIGVEYTSHQ